MRLLLILALMIASIGVGPPAGARENHEHAQHHPVTAHGEHDGDGERSAAHAVAHVCPGCALVGEAVVLEEEMVPQALPGLPANPPALVAFGANPIPPPPRFV
jgi:hypothetical protein